MFRDAGSSFAVVCVPLIGVVALLGGMSDPDPKQDPAVSELNLLKIEKKAQPHLQTLLMQRYNAALTVFQMLEQRPADVRTPDDLVDALQPVLISERDLPPDPARRTALCEKYLEIASHLEHQAELMHRAGRITRIDLERARYLRLDAEIQLLRAQEA